MNCDESYDTFESMMLERINKSLNQNEFKQLTTNEWSELYVKLFMNIYLQICGLSRMSYIRHTSKTIEPVTIHVDIKQQRSSNPTILHSISIPFLKLIFNDKCYKQVENSSKCFFKIPSVFPLVHGVSENYSNNAKVLDLNLSNRLIRYYVYADHAAYHYHQFIKNANADYKHINIINRCSNNRPSDIVHCHDIISFKPNKHLNKYLQPHDVLKVEDQEHENSYLDMKYSNMFETDDSD